MRVQARTCAHTPENRNRNVSLEPSRPRFTSDPTDTNQDCTMERIEQSAETRHRGIATFISREIARRRSWAAPNALASPPSSSTATMPTKRWASGESSTQLKQVHRV